MWYSCVIERFGLKCSSFYVFLILGINATYRNLTSDGDKKHLLGLYSL